MSPQFSPGAPLWVDLGTSDVDAAMAFYGELFGWTFDEGDEEFGGYRSVRKNGKMVAGLAPLMSPEQPVAWSVYFKSDDATETTALTSKNGGSVIAEPMAVGDLGTMAVYLDPTGAAFGAWQPREHKGFELMNEPGSFSWTELMTPDMAAAKPFYESVLGVATRDVDMGDGNIYTLLETDGKSVAGGMGIQEEWGPMPPHWSVYFEVDDVDAVADKAVLLGGTEMMRQDSPAGRFAYVTDPQGGAFAFIKSDPNFSA